MLQTVHVDGNHFYPACERVFNAALWGRPVVVLSNNDGNVIARTDEAKALGIPMGAPAFEWWPLFRREGVVVRSSNYPLYGEMSHRLMATLAQLTSCLTVYSIDEAFLECRPKEGQTLFDYAREIQIICRKWIGLPVGVGIGATKTLAKLANKTAKSEASLKGICILDPGKTEALLGETETERIWGIGPKRAARLMGVGIKTARQLRDMDDGAARKLLTVTGYRTVLELRGISCISFEEPTPARKTFNCSQSFGRPVTSLSDLKEAVAYHAMRAAEKLRRAGLAAGYISVEIETNSFRKDEPRYSGKRGFRLGIATSYTPHLIRAAQWLVEKLYREGYNYHKAGVFVSKLEKADKVQLPLLSAVPDLESEWAEMADYDREKRDGRRPEEPPRSWEMRREWLSPPYTTDWASLPLAEVDERGD